MQPNTMTIDHKGEHVDLPYIVHNATSVNLYSLFDYDFACRLCDGENYKPIIIKTPDGGKKAAGAVAAFDYKKTSLVPYREWSLVIFVAPENRETPEVDYINETSLFFQSILDDDLIGNIVFSPKLILSEPLPTEVGVEYYGLPKELGEINYSYNQELSNFSVSTKQGPWVMKASFPTKRGILEKFKLLWAMFKAYKACLVLRSLGKKEFFVTLAGSAKILPKNAYMKIRNDPKTEMFPWNNKDCEIKINPESEWGKILLDLKLEPKLVCHVPNLQFEFSEPLDQ
jgi:hypothetical protein